MRTVPGPSDRVVVVGAGFAGLAAALHLAGRGREVTMVERENWPGGRAGRLDVDGYYKMAEAGILKREQGVELIDGEIIDMNPIGSPHAAVTNRLARLNYANIHIHAGDGTLGLPQFAPFDCIVVSAAAPAPPAPLLAQLAEGGHLVVPVGDVENQNLHLIERWTRTGPTSLEYVATIEDPTVWTRPWTVKQEFTRQSEEANRLYTEPRCVEGNYGHPGLMRGARAEEIA